jgi:hypothetical protein
MAHDNFIRISEPEYFLCPYCTAELLAEEKGNTANGKQFEN